MPREKVLSQEQITSGSWPAEIPTLREVPLPERLHIPLTVEGSGSYELRIAVGARIDAGEVIATASPHGHRPISPAAGTLVSVDDVPLIAGHVVPTAQIRTVNTPAPVSGWTLDDPADPARESQLLSRVRKFRPTDFSTILDRLRDAGVWANRVSSPDLLGQLHHVLKRPVDNIVCNALDGDPNSCINTVLCARYPARVLAGTMLLAQISGAGAVWIVGEAGSPPAWWSPIRRLARDANARFALISNRYPQADPTLLLHTLFDRHLRPSRLPTEQGTIVIDPASAIAISHAILDDRPMTHVPLAVRDHASKQSHFLIVPIGIKLKDVIASLIQNESATRLVRCGDVLRDMQCSVESSVTARELCLHLTPRERVELSDPCIRCNWCADLCPTRVQPAALLEAAQRRDVRHIERHGIDSCIECGICSYVCPSKLPLLEGIRALKIMRLEEQVGEA